MKTTAIVFTALLTLFAGLAHASLRLEISGVPGAGVSTWVLWGSATATNPPATHDFPGNNNVAGGADGWDGVGAGCCAGVGISGNVAPISGVGTLTVGGVDYNITRVRTGTNLGGFIGFATDHATHIDIPDGTVVSWSATFVFPFDVNDFATGFTNEHAGLDLDVVVVPTELRIDVTGTPGSGMSTWYFSGASTTSSVGSQSFGGSNSVSGGSETWNNIGGGCCGSVGVTGNIAPTSGTATLTVGGVDYNITRARYGTNIGGLLGLATDNPTDIDPPDGTVVSWSGSLTFPIDITEIPSFTNNEHMGLDLRFISTTPLVSVEATTWSHMKGIFRD